ncbi:MAG: serine/threonine-protein kinase, partial [Gemmatimonadales bacterium]
MTDVLDRLRKALADRYTIEREIGSGGMATVYLAEDLKHHRKVAIKVLRADLAATLGPERFLREIEVAAQLQHPHILPLHDSGEADGFLYYVMPFVEGQSLRDKLAKEGELPIGEAVRILRDVADALTAAHAHGVVHRDIKPENILLSGRHALVTDFGVAKAVSEATGREQLTTAGVALGTPAYMAPEQAAADPHLDHRVDLYAVGAVAYELLTGRPVFMGTTPQMVLSAHVTEAPQPVTKHRDTVPAALESVVMRCLEKKPADRWQTAEELLPQLEALATPSGGMTPTQTAPVTAHGRSPRRAWMIGAAATAAAVAVIYLLVMRPSTREQTTVSVEPDSTWRMLVVADFTHAPEDSTLALGVSDAVRGALQNIVGVEVLDRSTMMDFMERFLGVRGMPAPDSVFRLANNLGLHGMVSGSVQRMGPGFVLSVNLRPTVAGSVQITLSETATDSTQLVDAVQRLGATLRERLIEEAPRLERPPFEMPVTARSLQARRIFGDAVRAWGTDYFAVVNYLRQAIRLDSTFGSAHRRLSAALATLGIRRAERVRAIEAAYAVRDSLMPWERGLVTGMYHRTRGERDEGIAAYRRLLEDIPEFSIALNNLGNAYSTQRDYGLAERLYRTWADTTGSSYEWYEYMW